MPRREHGRQREHKCDVEREPHASLIWAGMARRQRDGGQHAEQQQEGRGERIDAEGERVAREPRPPAKRRGGDALEPERSDRGEGSRARDRERSRDRGENA